MSTRDLCTKLRDEFRTQIVKVVTPKGLGNRREKKLLKIITQLVPLENLEKPMTCTKTKYAFF